MFIYTSTFKGVPSLNPKGWWIDKSATEPFRQPTLKVLGISWQPIFGCPTIVPPAFPQQVLAVRHGVKSHEVLMDENRNESTNMDLANESNAESWQPSLFINWNMIRKWTCFIDMDCIFPIWFKASYSWRYCNSCIIPLKSEWSSKLSKVGSSINNPCVAGGRPISTRGLIYLP